MVLLMIIFVILIIRLLTTLLTKILISKYMRVVSRLWRRGRTWYSTHDTCSLLGFSQGFSLSFSDVLSKFSQGFSHFFSKGLSQGFSWISWCFSCSSRWVRTFISIKFSSHVASHVASHGASHGASYDSSCDSHHKASHKDFLVFIWHQFIHNPQQSHVLGMLLHCTKLDTLWYLFDTNLSIPPHSHMC